MSTHMIISFVIWILIGVGTGYLAKQRGRDPSMWFFIGMLLGLIGLVILFLLPKSKESDEIDPSSLIESDGSALNVPQITNRPDFSQKMWFYVNQERTQHGPISFDEFRTLWRNNSLNIESLVWSEGMDSWKTIAQIHNLTESLDSE